MVASQSLGANSETHGTEGGRRMIRWLTLAGGAALLAGCVAPSYPVYPAQLYLPPPYVAQPLFPAPQPGPVPLYPAPAPRQEAAPTPEISVDPRTDEPEPEPAPEPAPEAASPAAPTAQVPETVAPPPSSQAGPGADAPLQGFRPMRGQTRPGI